MIGRASDEALDACVAPMLRLLFDEPPGPWPRHVTAQLVAVVEYRRARASDPVPARMAGLEAALAGLAGNALVPAEGSPSARAAAALSSAVGRSDGAADAVRAALRPVLLAELDGELAETMAMMDGFRGRLGDA